jgi:endonuclease YncB( thermonuclease family)
MIPAEAWDRAHLWQYRARLVRVIDGDTLVALVDTGFYGRQEVHLRLAGVNAPELHQPGGREAEQALAGALISNLSPPRPEWYLRVVTLQRERVVSEVTSFERYVAHVWVQRGDFLYSLAGLLQAPE